MLLDREMTPGLERELCEQQFVIAYNKAEALQKAKADGYLDIAASILDFILERWKGRGTSWSILKGLKVLDLGSGSSYSRDTLGIWYPHFSRLCAVNGADVVAIDINPQSKLDKTIFSCYEEDLVDVVLNIGLQNLPILKGRKFEIVHSSNFVGSNFCPELPHQLTNHRTSKCEFEKLFFKQAGELLTEGGVMNLDIRDIDCLPILYTKKENDIVELK